MRKILYIFMAMAVLAGCRKNPDSSGTDNPPPATIEEKIAGEWHCSPSNIDAEIYISFTAEGNFELYQKITEGAFRLYRGTWSIDHETMVIAGKYNDGESWGSSYNVTLSEDLNSMTFADSASIEHVYSRQEIPTSVKENCVVEVKSPYAY